jgi:dGTPase
MMNWEKLLASGRFQQKLQLENSSNSFRTEFERDYDRIIFSAPFRNLQDKTQVFPLPEHDFVHTRLTHSLEVSSVGRSLGRSCGEYLILKYPHLTQQGINASDVGAIVAAAALSHDIGNPPFGHAGEEAISDFFKFHAQGAIWKDWVTPEEWADLSNFEGNAQGFRMLTAKNNGLKLSYATLATFTKYPRPAHLLNVEKGRKSQKKYGFFTDQNKTFSELATVLGISAINKNCWLRHPLAFLVEAADDICYSIIDLEDGCTLGLVSLSESVSLMAEIIGEKYNPQKLNEYPETSQKLAILRAMAIGELIHQTVNAFKENEEDMLKGSFDQALTDILPATTTLKKISKLSVHKIYRSKPVLEKETAGYQVLEGLLEVFSKALYHHFYDKDNYSGKDKSLLRLLPEGFPLEGFHEGINPYPLLRSLIDFISGMTDKHALSLYRKVKGISLPGI